MTNVCRPAGIVPIGTKVRESPVVSIRPATPRTAMPPRMADSSRGSAVVTVIALVAGTISYGRIDRVMEL